MSEILFTGKRKYTDDWVEGYYLYRGEECSKIGTDVHYIVTHDLCGFSWHEVIPETVGQFTGLYDNTKWEELTLDEQQLFLYPKLRRRRTKEEWKGKRIYSGYILKGAWNTRFSVFYDEVSSSFRAKTSDGFERELSYFGIDKLKVIGHVHETPELLIER